MHARGVLQHLAQREAVLDAMIAAAKPGGWIVVERRRLDPVRRAAGARAVRDAVAHAARAQHAASTATTARGAACSSTRSPRAGSTDVDARGEVWTMHGGTDSAEWYVAALDRALDVIPAEVFPPGFDPARRDRPGARARRSRSSPRSRSPPSAASRCGSARCRSAISSRRCSSRRPPSPRSRRGAGRARWRR